MGRRRRMIEPLDERGDLVDQLERSVCAQICRGVYRAGDAIEAPADAAKRVLVNPRCVRDAYERLRGDGALDRDATGGYVVTGDAMAKARQRLTESAKGQLARTLALLADLGVDEAAVDDIIAGARSRPNGPTA